VDTELLRDYLFTLQECLDYGLLEQKSVGSLQAHCGLHSKVITPVVIVQFDKACRESNAE